MTPEDDIVLQKLSTRVRQLILSYQELAEENAKLRAQIGEKEAQVEQLLTTCDELRQHYENLKVAAMMKISNGDLEEAKAKLSRLTREVNKCIALLSV